MAATTADDLRSGVAPTWSDDAPRLSPPAPQTGVTTALLRYRWSSAAVVVGFLLLSGAVGVVTGASTSAVAQVELTTPGPTSLLSPGGTSDAVVARYTAQRAAFATSDRVLSRVAQQTGASVAELRGAVVVTSAEGTNSLTVVADAESADRSVEVADALVQAYRQQADLEVGRLTGAALEALRQGTEELQARLVERSTGAAAQSAATTLSDLEQQANALRTERAVFGDGVQFVSAAVPGEAPALPLRELALGAVVGLALAAAIAWLRADRDRRIDAGGDAAGALDAPLLGAVREVDDLDDGSSGLDGLPSAPYRPVVPALSLRASAGVVLVTSARAGEGRTQTALNLAVSAAREGLRVLLVDADVESGDLSRACGVGPDVPGTSDLYVSGAVPWSAGLLRTVALGRGARLQLLPAGTERSAHPDVQVRVVAQSVEGFRQSHDLVVVDAAALPTGGLPAVLARAADRVLVVARQGSSAEDAAQLRHLLSLFGTPVAGVLLTFSSDRHASGLRPSGLGQRRAHRAHPAGAPRTPSDPSTTGADGSSERSPTVPAARQGPGAAGGSGTASPVDTAAGGAPRRARAAGLPKARPTPTSTGPRTARRPPSAGR